MLLKVLVDCSRLMGALLVFVVLTGKWDTGMWFASKLTMIPRLLALD